jgi:hypothetical protein
MNMLKLDTKQLAYVRFLDADTEWSKELLRQFGRGAGDARYEKRGKGDQGSTLRKLHDAREDARHEWEARTGCKAD